MTGRRLSAFIDALTDGRRPRSYRAGPEDAETLRMAPDDRRQHSQDAERLRFVLVRARQRGQAQQPERGRGAAGGDRRVVEVLAPRKAVGLAGAGREEAAALGIGESV